MDIHGGKGICLGPRNYLGRGYQNAPIGITVEGANILSRSLIIFGQGAIRCHPHVLAEMDSVRQGDLKAFDQALFAHTGFVLSNALRSLGLALSDGRIARGRPAFKRYQQLICRYSAHLALLSDVSMIVLGGSLKRKESF